MIRSKLMLIYWVLAVGPVVSVGQSMTMADEASERRRPLPLLQMMADHQKRMMRDHLGAVQEIVTALATDDFVAVQRAAARLGFSEEVGRMCTRIGAASPAFTQQALAFHHTADGIAAAARERSRRRVLAELSTTLKACRACHSGWKQDIVDEPTWNRLTSHE
jgi:cytochrome c556